VDVRLVVRLTAALVAGGAAAWLAGVMIALPSGSVATAVVLRTLLTLATVGLLTRLVVRRAYDGPDLARTLWVAAVVSGALFPPTWLGRALAGQLVLDPGPLTVVIDLVLWVGLVVLAGRSVSPQEDLGGYHGR
jgi:hypothetical protein